MANVEDIVSGVDCVYLNPDAVPGAIVVYGEHAFPILTTHKCGEVLIAAAHFGMGRIVVFSHDAFIKDFCSRIPVNPRLYENIKCWVTSGNYSPGGIIIDLDKIGNIEDTHSAKVLVTTSGSTKHSMESLASLVWERGIGLVCGICPWGWRQLNSDQPLENMPIASIMARAGLCYTSSYVSTNGGSLHISNNQANESHLGRVCQQELDSSSTGVQLLPYIQHLTAPAFATLQPRLEQMLHSNCSNIKAPCETQPVSDPRIKGFLAVQEAIYTNSDLTSGVKAFGVEHFPGDYTVLPILLSSVEVNIEPSVDIEEMHSTGYYLPPGQQLVVTVINGDVAGWQLQIGIHSDDLSYLDAWKRWPKITSKKCLQGHETKTVSPFGGLVYIWSPARPKCGISVQLSNVVAAPYYDVTKPGYCTLQDWTSRRHAPGLWAEIAGRHIIITLPSASVRDVEDPRGAIEHWDKVVKLHHELRTTDVSKHRRERMVTDVQPSYGYMHAGYPIVTHIDVAQPSSKQFLLHTKTLWNEGHWGPYHELGHNMQRDTWTYPDVSEVTVNIFSLHAMDRMTNDKLWLHSHFSSDLKHVPDHLASGAPYENMRPKLFMYLIIFAQLAYYFGWCTYQKVFQYYENLVVNDHPRNDQEKKDMWFEVFCDKTGYNLIPLFEFWGMMVSEAAKNRVADRKLPYFLPEDEVTLLGQQRLKQMQDKYPCCQTKKPAENGSRPGDRPAPLDGQCSGVA